MRYFRRRAQTDGWVSWILALWWDSIALSRSCAQRCRRSFDAIDGKTVRYASEGRRRPHARAWGAPHWRRAGRAAVVVEEDETDHSES